VEFVRILNETQWTELREDLFFLVEKGLVKTGHHPVMICLPTPGNCVATLSGEVRLRRH
jgi:hypothetical protein